MFIFSGRVMVWGVVMAVMVSGCAIQQKVQAVPLSAGTQELCVIENSAVRNGFLDTFKSAVARKGYTVRLLPSTSPITECPTSITYTARWRWDLALYMSFAEIRVFREGKQAGEALYSSESGSGNLGKFIDAEKKITELVNQLFPGGAG